MFKKLVKTQGYGKVHIFVVFQETANAHRNSREKQKMHNKILAQIGGKLKCGMIFTDLSNFYISIKKLLAKRFFLPIELILFYFHIKLL